MLKVAAADNPSDLNNHKTKSGCAVMNGCFCIGGVAGTDWLLSGCCYTQPLQGNGHGHHSRLHAVSAQSPDLLVGYQSLHNLAFESSIFIRKERTVVWKAANDANTFCYCAPARIAIAIHKKTAEGVINALRSETPLPAKLEA